MLLGWSWRVSKARHKRLDWCGHWGVIKRFWWGKEKALPEGDGFAGHMGSAGGATRVSPARPEDPSFVARGIEGLRKTLCGGEGTKHICSPSGQPPSGPGHLSGTEKTVWKSSRSKAAWAVGEPDGRFGFRRVWNREFGIEFVLEVTQIGKWVALYNFR